MANSLPDATGYSGEQEKDLGAVSATAVDAVSCSVPAPELPHADPVLAFYERVCVRAVADPLFESDFKAAMYRAFIGEGYAHVVRVHGDLVTLGSYKKIGREIPCDFPIQIRRKTASNDPQTASEEAIRG